jgi:hypothetical protein
LTLGAIAMQSMGSRSLRHAALASLAENALPLHPDRRR